MKMQETRAYASQNRPGFFSPNTSTYNLQQQSCSIARWDFFVGILHYLAVLLLVCSICTFVETERTEVLKKGNVFVGMKCAWKSRANLGAGGPFQFPVRWC